MTNYPTNLISKHPSKLTFLEVEFVEASYFVNTWSLSSTSVLLWPLKTERLFLDMNLPCSLPEFEGSADICFGFYSEATACAVRDIFPVCLFNSIIVVYEEVITCANLL